jgi:hypothetical protein
MLIKIETRSMNWGDLTKKRGLTEDYLLSKQIKPRRFKTLNTTVFTPPRRFENTRSVIYDEVNDKILFK